LILLVVAVAPAVVPVIPPEYLRRLRAEGLLDRGRLLQVS
jgi:hypothetical protein